MLRYVSAAAVLALVALLVDRSEAETMWNIRKSEYDDCRRANRCNCQDPGPPPGPAAPSVERADAFAVPPHRRRSRGMILPFGTLLTVYSDGRFSPHDPFRVDGDQLRIAFGDCTGRID